MHTHTHSRTYMRTDTHIYIHAYQCTQMHMHTCAQACTIHGAHTLMHAQYMAVLHFRIHAHTYIYSEPPRPLPHRHRHHPLSQPLECCSSRVVTFESCLVILVGKFVIQNWFQPVSYKAKNRQPGLQTKPPNLQADIIN